MSRLLQNYLKGTRKMFVSLLIIVRHRALGRNLETYQISITNSHEVEDLDHSWFVSAGRANLRW